MLQAKPYVLSIAGFDPSAGAGVLADIKTFEANGVYSFGAVSALTWQNDIAFEKVEWLAVDKIIGQIEVLLKRFEIRYFKIGLIENFDVLNEIVNFLTSRAREPIVVFDPILKASAGFVFHETMSDRYLESLKGIYCITPNIPEAERLFGQTNLNDKLEALSEHTNIYLKGGHDNENTVVDLLYTSDHTYAFSNDRLPEGAKHGSGCVLSAALVAQLALGNELAQAAENANAYTYRFLASNNTLLGYHQPYNV